MWKIIDPIPRETEFLYDANRRLIDVNDVFGNTHYDYHVKTGEVWKIEDAKDHITEMGQRGHSLIPFAFRSRTSRP